MSNDTKCDRAETETAIPVISVAIEDMPKITGLSRSRIYEDARDGKLCVRKNGRSSVVELSEIQRYIRSLPYRGRAPEQVAAA